jgi:PAS domain S-box-containing protein
MKAGRPQWKLATQRTLAAAFVSSKPVNTLVKSFKEDTDDFLRAIVDACVSNVAVLDESGAILYTSNAWRLLDHATTSEPELFEYSFESFKRLPASEFDGGADVTLAEDLRRILYGGEKEFHRNYYCSLFNNGHPFVMHAARLNLPGSTFRVLMTHEDLPAAREDLKHTKERLTQLLETTKVVSWEAEVEAQRFTYVSEQAVKMLGFPTRDWYEPNFFASHLHPHDRRRVLSAYQTQARLVEHFDLTFRMIGNEGRVAWVQNLVSITPESDTPARMHGFMIDISERKRNEEALKHLGSRLIAAQEEERKRIARELHDDLNQRMAVLSIELDQLSRETRKSLGLQKRLHRMQLQAQEISSDIHRLSYKLHPSKLDHLGLTAALKSLCEELTLTQNGQLRVHFHQSKVPADLPKDVTLCLFRIAQETLRNSVKHSGADSVQVVLTKTYNSIRLSISDNGCGFDTSSDLMDKGLGFISMHERLRLVGGEIKICSKPLRGTRIDVLIPLHFGNLGSKEVL